MEDKAGRIESQKRKLTCLRAGSGEGVWAGLDPILQRLKPGLFSLYSHV